MEDDPDMRTCDVMFLTRQSYPEEMVEFEELLLQLTRDVYTINPTSVIWACIWYLTILFTATFFQMVILPIYLLFVIAYHGIFGIDEKPRPV